MMNRLVSDTILSMSSGCQSSTLSRPGQVCENQPMMEFQCEGDNYNFSNPSENTQPSKSYNVLIDFNTKPSHIACVCYN